MMHWQNNLRLLLMHSSVSYIIEIIFKIYDIEGYYSAKKLD